MKPALRNPEVEEAYRYCGRLKIFIAAFEDNTFDVSIYDRRNNHCIIALEEIRLAPGLRRPQGKALFDKVAEVAIGFALLSDATDIIYQLGDYNDDDEPVIRHLAAVHKTRPRT